LRDPHISKPAIILKCKKNGFWLQNSTLSLFIYAGYRLICARGPQTVKIATEAKLTRVFFKAENKQVVKNFRRRYILNNNLPEIPLPEVCARRIFEMSGVEFEPNTAADLWIRIIDHKWLLSEKVGRDMGYHI
jgi:hypothetical protein